MPLPSRAHTFAIQTCRDMLEKLEREVVCYRQAVNKQSPTELLDASFNAAVTAWHIADWVFCDMTTEQRLQLKCHSLSDLQTRARTDCRSIHLCRQVATASKHVQVSHYPDHDVQAYAAAEPDWTTYFRDKGRRINAEEVFNLALGYWTQFIYNNEIGKQ